MWERVRQSPDWRFVAALITLMALLQAIGPEYFRYERDWTSTGEIWRNVTAHWVHVGWLHLLLNALGLVICVSLTNPGWSIRRWLTISITVAIGISIMLTLFNPEVSDYAGYSGVLYGLYVLAAISLFSGDRLIAGLNHTDSIESLDPPPRLSLPTDAETERLALVMNRREDDVGATVKADGHGKPLVKGLPLDCAQRGNSRFA